jgi:tRNA(Ile)-lysidine synthase
LTGIKEKSGKIIRPMLFASRSDIEKYASEQYIEYMEDSTNSEVVYQRNYLRHKILPLFSSLNPAFKKNMLASIENLKDAEAIYSEYFETEKQSVVEITSDAQIIDIENLKKAAHSRLLLFEILTQSNFNPAVAEEVFQSLTNESGKQFYSKTHRLVKDRKKLFISEIANNDNRIFYIENDDVELFEPFDLTIEKLPSGDFKISKEQNIACLDLEKLEFPLLMRKWQEGDYFQPLGMTGFKKLSDFFIDEKVPVHQKENTWLFCSGEKIVWIVGMRIDNRFKIDSKTNQVLKITKIR